MIYPQVIYHPAMDDISSKLLYAGIGMASGAYLVFLQMDQEAFRCPKLDRRGEEMDRFENLGISGGQRGGPNLKSFCALRPLTPMRFPLCETATAGQAGGQASRSAPAAIQS